MAQSLGSLYRSYGDYLRSLFGSPRWRIARNGLLVGVLAGLASSLYRGMLAKVSDLAKAGYEFLRTGKPISFVVWLIAAVIAALVVSKLISWEPMASGSGIPQVKGILNHKLTMRPMPVIAARFAGGAAGSVFGLSLGREGPSIHIGAATALLLARPLKATAEEQDHLITSGASAGLAAAFSAPVSGMLFGIEGLHRSFSPLVIASAATGALSASAVATAIFGSHPILQFGEVDVLTLPLLWVVLPLGVLTGLMGSLVNWLLLAWQSLLGRVRSRTAIFITIAVALPCGLWLPQVLGGGEHLIGWAEFEAGGIGLIAVLLVFKILFTSVSFGSGVPGGIFMPILAIGTLTGAGYALAAHALGLPSQYQPILAVCGMAGVLAASVRTPLTSILLTAEMTGSLAHLLPVATVVIIAVFTADALRVPPIYEELLKRTLRCQPPAALN